MLESRLVLFSLLLFGICQDDQNTTSIINLQLVEEKIYIYFNIQMFVAVVYNHGLPLLKVLSNLNMLAMRPKSLKPMK